MKFLLYFVHMLHMYISSYFHSIEQVDGNQEKFSEN